MRRPTVAAVLTALVVLLGLAGPAAAAADAGDTGVVLVGVPGLAWTDVDPATTPTLERLAEHGSVASMTVRAVRSRSCAVDGWLTLSAGRRAADVAGPCRAPAPVGSNGAVPRWDQYLAAARRASYDARPGTLGQSLASAGTCVQAVGPGAAIAAADPSGHVARYAATLPDRLSCPLTLVDGGSLPVDPGARTAALADVDALVSRVLERVDTGTRVVVAGVGDGDSPIRPRAVLRSGPPPGLLTSASTRQPGLVQLQDLTATLVDDLGTPVEGLTGRPVTAEPGEGSGAERVDRLAGFEVRAGTLRSVSPQVTGWLAAAFAAWCLVAAVALWRRGPQAPLPAAVRVTGAAVASVPVATFVANLVPWWSAGAPALMFSVVLAVVVVVLTALAVLADRHRRLGGLLVVAVVTLLVLVGDVVTGSGLQLASVFGQNPTVGGRFYGLGNTSYALYGVAATTVVAVLATSRRGSLRHVLGLPVLALIALTAVEAHPSLGADFGGPPGLVLGGLVVLAGAAGIRLTWVRALVAAVAVVALTAGIAVVDWLRPPAARTHLGEFVQTVLDGGMDDVIGRKLAQNLTNLTSPPLVTIALAALVLVAVAWRRGWRPGPAASLVLRGTAVLALVGFGVNDSGLVIPAFAALALLPLLTAQGRAEPAGSTSSTSTPPASLGWTKLTRLPLVPRRGAS